MRCVCPAVRSQEFEARRWLDQRNRPAIDWVFAGDIMVEIRAVNISTVNVNQSGRLNNPSGP